ncbi:MAG: phosphoribosylpyrophosphate synthetase [Candidatus Dadabacteria bacterium]
MKKYFGTLSETVNGLKREGYDHDFNLKEECLICHETNVQLSPAEFEIDAVFRFEGESNPDDEAVVYAISSPVHGIKGVLVNAYGIYGESTSDALVEKLEKNNKS